MRSRPMARGMLNRGTTGQRRLGRVLARGRFRADPALGEVIDAADRLIKDFGASPPSDATVGQDVHTDTAGGGGRAPRHNPRQTRYRGSIPIDDHT